MFIIGGPTIEIDYNVYYIAYNKYTVYFTTNTHERERLLAVLVQLEL